MKLDQTLANAITAAGQADLLRFWDTLTEEQQSAFASQLAGVNWQEMPRLIAEYVLQRPKTEIPADLGPAGGFPAGGGKVPDVAAGGGGRDIPPRRPALRRFPSGVCPGFGIFWQSFHILCKSVNGASSASHTRPISAPS